VFTNALGEEKLLRDHAFSQFLCCLRRVEDCDSRTGVPHEFIASGRVGTEFPAISFSVDKARRGGAGRNPERPGTDGVAGNLSRVDLLHLRGHLDIPRFKGDGLKAAQKL
jgi:hypothetical protein